MIVVDVGCANYGSQDSLAALAAEYLPDRIYGFDPSVKVDESVKEIAGVPATLTRKAAWLYDGEVPFEFAESRSKIVIGNELVPCIDLSRFLQEQAAPTVLKLDIEAAEYLLLAHLVAEGTNSLLEEVVVEWHRGVDEDLVAALGCPVREWWM